MWVRQSINHIVNYPNYLLKPSFISYIIVSKVDSIKKHY